MTGLFTFRYKSASLLLINWDDGHATISELHSRRQGKGHATKLLTKVIHLADTLELDLVLEAHAYGKKKHRPSNTQLQAFYEKHGFVVLNTRMPVFMKRKHR